MYYLSFLCLCLKKLFNQSRIRPALWSISNKKICHSTHWSVLNWFQFNLNFDSHKHLSVYWWDKKNACTVDRINDPWIRNFATETNHLMDKWYRAAHSTVNSLYIVLVSGLENCLTRIEESIDYVSIQVKMSSTNMQNKFLLLRRSFP